VTTAAASALLLLLTAPPPTPSTPPAPSASSPADERLRAVRDRRSALQKDLARLRSEERSLLGEVERLELEVRLRGEELRETQLVLQRTNEQMDVTVRRARDLEQSISAARPVLAARARALYKLGELSYLRMLLSVERPSDIFRGYRFVSALARRDNQRIAGLRSDLAALAATRAELERKTREALELRTSLERTRRGLDADRQRKEKLLTEIVERKETHAAYLQELEEAEGRLQSLLQGLTAEDVAVPIPVFKGSLPWPVAGRVRVAFGRRKHPRFDTYTVENGIEIAAPEGATVTAVHEGTVAFADRFRGYGLMVVIDHGGKHHTLYAHLAELRVQAGQKVTTGQVLGVAGGSVEGPGLYFEIRFQGRPEDPAEWLTRAEGRSP
jgi:septal ring factor EnvC (AmiA/AmiB activator)